MWSYYIDINSETFSNALQSALRAGYDQSTAQKITSTNWFKERLDTLDLVEDSEKTFVEILKMSYEQTIYHEGKPVGKRIDPMITKIKQDTAKFLVERLEKNKYSKRLELTTPDGAKIVEKKAVEETLKALDQNITTDDSQSTAEAASEDFIE